MESKLFIFARFHVRGGSEQEAVEALREVLGPTREETGCLNIHLYRSVRDPRLFYVYSDWTDEAAFDHHTSLPHTVRFIERIKTLVDQRIEVTRSEILD
jgi:quinol monooxygenase YgiN